MGFSVAKPLKLCLTAAAFYSALIVAPLAANSVGTFLTSGGERKIQVELADTPSEREIGLMDRAMLSENAGMLFDFGETRSVTMWMKNTLISLDMLFLNDQGIVTRIKERAKPESLDLIPSGKPVHYVLELNGGDVARLGVKVGDRFHHVIIPGPPDGQCCLRP